MFIVSQRLVLNNPGSRIKPESTAKTPPMILQATGLKHNEVMHWLQQTPRHNQCTFHAA
ncbi:MAG: hypothetical protein JSR71_07740 [Proteobacteria bacterium]|nr:hypothetical protein [Pseudomonadota bacterium]